LATISDYLYIAAEIYSRTGGTDGGAGWNIQRWETATWYGNGFQGGIFMQDNEIIVAFSGTMGGPTTAPVSQNTANIRIGLHVIPNMAGSAKTLVRWAEQYNRPISIVGHSLGGALAQVIGAWSGHPFISFNGPGMARHLQIAAFNIFKPRQMRRSIKALRADDALGICFNVRGDFVAGFGKHIGVTVDLQPAPGRRTHDLTTIQSCLVGNLIREPWHWNPLWPMLRAPQLAAPSFGPSLSSMVGV
jgi:hypothetical protein